MVPGGHAQLAWLCLAPARAILTLPQARHSLRDSAFEPRWRFMPGADASSMRVELSSSVFWRDPLHQ
jgi:hypothetical protein